MNQGVSDGGENVNKHMSTISILHLCFLFGSCKSCNKVYEISQKMLMRTEQIISIQAVFFFFTILIDYKNNVTNLL